MIKLYAGDFMKGEDVLKSKGIKNTLHRRVILDVLQEQEKYCTCEEIFELCKLKCNNLNISTIYRNLELFHKNGMVLKVVLTDGTFSYLIETSSHTHTLNCSICHKQIEINCPIGQVSKDIKDKTGFILSHDMEFYGICKDCNNKKH